MSEHAVAALPDPSSVQKSGSGGGKARPKGTEQSALKISSAPKRVRHQNSYRLEPVTKFNSDRALAIIKASFHDRFDGGTKKFAPETYPELSKVLADEIKERVKDLRVDRYKIVCVVYIGEKVDVSLIVASRCLCFSNVDTYATYTFENMEMFATGTVYAFYNE